jgi:hypothetical protein
LEELVLFEIVEYSLEKLAETCTLLGNFGRPVILNWAEGVAFHHNPLPMNNKDLLKERMKGRIYWANLIYALMPVYKPNLKVGARDIPVIVTPNPILKKVAEWIKKEREK